MPTKGQIGAAVAAAAIVAVGVVLNARDARNDESPQPKTVTVDWSGAVPRDVKCYQGQWADRNFQGRGFKYEWSTKCNPTDEELVTAVGDLTEVAFDGGPKSLRTVDEDAQWPCACSTGRQCERQDNAGNWVDASTWNNVIGPTKWRGAGCRRMACGQLAGSPTPYPAECVQ